MFGSTEAFKEPGLYVPWIPADGTFHTWHCPVPFSGYEKLATLISNSQSLLNPLDHIVKKAWDMFASRYKESKLTVHSVSVCLFYFSLATGYLFKKKFLVLNRAYIHQYTKFGISEEDFLESFTTLEQIVSSYTHL